MSNVVGVLTGSPSSAPKPARPLTVDELVNQVRRASLYVAEAEERHTFMVKSLASLFDELKVARRTLKLAEENLVRASKQGAVVPVASTSTNTTKAK